MAARPLISVVIPTYNYATVIVRALDSVLGQWDDDLELLVIDDGSRDSTWEVLTRYVRVHSQPIRLVLQENAGPGAARNHGIRLAMGDFILLLDADDALMPGAIVALRQAVRAHPDVGMVLGGQTSVYPGGRERRRLPTPVAGTPLQRARRYLLEKRISISHGSSLFRRDLLLQRPYPEDFRGGEDIPVFTHMLVNAQVAVVNESLVRIYKHDDSLRHRRKEDATGHVLKMSEEVFASLPAECQNLRRRYEAQRYLSLFRAASACGENMEALTFYQKAFSISPGQALRWNYVRKYIKLKLMAKCLQGY